VFVTARAKLQWTTHRARISKNRGSEGRGRSPLAAFLNEDHTLRLGRLAVHPPSRERRFRRPPYIDIVLANSCDVSSRPTLHARSVPCSLT